MQWLAVSILLSVVLTVVLNVVLRAFPHAGEQIGHTFAARAEERSGGGVYVPWKAMIVISLVLTVGLNLFLWILR